MAKYGRNMSSPSN